MSDLPRKPLEGSPCNGCGLCCIATPCEIALEHVDGALPNRPCPALELRETIWRCGMVLRPTRYMGRPPGSTDEQFAEIDGVLGRRVRQALGEGECDAGPLVARASDPNLGLTAFEFLALGAVEGELDRAVLGVKRVLGL